VRLQTKLATAAAAGILALLTLRAASPAQILPAPAQRFVSYYQALDASPSRLGAWEKLLYSLALATAAPSPSTGGGEGPQTRIQRPTAF
jgi:hypothetical protein